MFCRGGRWENEGMFEPESVRVVRQLRDDILDGVRPPGSKLVERDLATELGVSRVPVRDALATLAAEGLVTLRPRTWAVVREFTASDIADLNEVRSALEAITFELVALRHDPESLRRLRADLDEELEAARAGDAVRARRAAADFHETATAIAGNDLLVELGQVMRSRMRWLLGRHDDLQLVADEHRELYEAVAGRDVPRVRALVARHVRTSGRLTGEHQHARAGGSRPV
ncbi:MAG: GntR family transcriptional regulator [Nonomuraea sp.]|nr:GntR family transcriptional regulator [Nonomuraea sp.]NUP77269.1 GntR family transcriptional regulator [Nonomuraea sp.]